MNIFLFFFNVFLFFILVLTVQTIVGNNTIWVLASGNFTFENVEEIFKLDGDMRICCFQFGFQETRDHQWGNRRISTYCGSLTFLAASQAFFFIQVGKKEHSWWPHFLRDTICQVAKFKYNSFCSSPFQIQSLLRKAYVGVASRIK